MPLKRLKLDESIKNMEEQKSRIRDPLVFFQIFPESMENPCTTKYIPFVQLF